MRVSLSLLGLMLLIGCSSDESGTGGKGTSGGDGGIGAVVGALCIPGDEAVADFSGFAETEANVEPHSPYCGASNVCLINHFRGRVSCPYGQNIPGMDVLPGVSHSERCHVSGGTDLVSVPVEPQLLARRPADAVYCSCHCAGKDTTVSYCQCPSGFACQDLIPDFEFGGNEGSISGSYCVRSGTEVDNVDTISPLTCNYADLDADGKRKCGDEITQDF